VLVEEEKVNGMRMSNVHMEMITIHMKHRKRTGIANGQTRSRRLIIIKRVNAKRTSPQENAILLNYSNMASSKASGAFKFQEFAAHTSAVRCAAIGRKSNQVIATGGEDRKVNVWAVGKPQPVLRLTGHTSSVECVAFDAEEEVSISKCSAILFFNSIIELMMSQVIVAGNQSGTVKLWDLEQAKVIRTLLGHRAPCISVEFHPYGDFFASGSLDTNLKIWDIRRKSCIQTYKGHSQGVSGTGCGALSTACAANLNMFSYQVFS
jgi:WD40 repeat protein